MDVFSSADDAFVSIVDHLRTDSQEEIWDAEHGGGGGDGGRELSVDDDVVATIPPHTHT